MAKDGVRKIPRGRVTRMASLGNMAVGVSNNMALAAGRTLLGGGIDSAVRQAASLRDEIRVGFVGDAREDVDTRRDGGDLGLGDEARRPARRGADLDGDDDGQS